MIKHSKCSAGLLSAVPRQLKQTLRQAEVGGSCPCYLKYTAYAQEQRCKTSPSPSSWLLGHPLHLFYSPYYCAAIVFSFVIGQYCFHYSSIQYSSIFPYFICEFRGSFFLPVMRAKSGGGVLFCLLWVCKAL